MSRKVFDWIVNESNSKPVTTVNTCFVFFLTSWRCMPACFSLLEAIMTFSSGKTIFSLLQIHPGLTWAEGTGFFLFIPKVSELLRNISESWYTNIYFTVFVKSQLKNKKHYQQISMRRTSQKSFGNRQDEKMKETKSRE